MISRAKKNFKHILNGMVMFVSINAVKTSTLQPSKSSVQHRKQPPFIRKTFWIHSSLRERNYVQETKTCGLILIVLRKSVQRICNKKLSISQNVANITIDINSIPTQKKRNEREEYFQENCKISFKNIEAYRSIISK